MKLFDYVLSGNCYKIRLLLDFLELSHEKQAVDFFPGREHKSDAFLQINPLGQIPVPIFVMRRPFLCILPRDMIRRERGGRSMILCN